MTTTIQEPLEGLRYGHIEPSNRLKDIYMLFSSPTPPSKPKQPPQTPEHHQIASHLEELTLTHINAINTRNFDTTSPAWTNLSQNFTSDTRPVCLRTGRLLNREEYVGQYRYLTEIRPEYQLDVKSMNTQLKVLTKGVSGGEVTMSLENSGNPPGVTRILVVMVEWQKNGNVWECVGARAARGLDEF